MVLKLRDLPRGYGKRIVHKKNEFLIIGSNWRALDDSESPESLVFYDSDMEHYLEATKLETKLDGTTTLHYQTKKLTMKIFTDSEQDYDQNLLNAYNIPERLTDKSQLYEIGPVLPLRFLSVVSDSEGHRIWKKIAEPGIDKGDFEIQDEYLDGITSVVKGTTYTAMKNQLNKQFSIYDDLGKIFVVEARDFKTENSGPLLKTDFVGKQNPVVMILADNVPVEALGFYGLIPFDSEELIVDSDTNLVYHHNVISKDSEIFAFTISDKIKYEELRFKYFRDSGDSELLFDDVSLIDKITTLIPQTILTHDSDIVVTSFTTYHEDDEPWKVFNDSENDGFKAELGVQSGFIGAVVNDETRIYKLDRVIIQNDEATIANNRPCDFRIEQYVLDSDKWYTIDTVKGFDGYTYNRAFDSDSETYADGYRVVFEQGQPDFDSDYNSLEVKRIQFQTTALKKNAYPGGKGFFVTEPDSDFYFNLYESETELYGFFAGAGGGGGGGDNGGGGWGGASTNIDRLVLPPGRYKIRIGAGGIGAINSENVAQFIPPGEDGGDTVLTDVTRGKDIVIAQGGPGGWSSWRDPNNGLEVHADSEARFAEMVHATVIVDSDYVREYRAQDGLQGGRGGTDLPGDRGGFQFGDSRPLEFGRPSGGYRDRIKTYDDAVTYLDSEDSFGSGGGGTPWGELFPAANSGGRNAGSPLGGQGPDGTPNRGGGGAGGDFNVRSINGVNEFRYWPGGNGGSGYAFLIFELNK